MRRDSPFSQFLKKDKIIRIFHKKKLSILKYVSKKDILGNIQLINGDNLIL